MTYYCIIYAKKYVLLLQLAQTLAHPSHPHPRIPMKRPHRAELPPSYQQASTYNTPHQLSSSETFNIPASTTSGAEHARPCFSSEEARSFNPQTEYNPIHFYYGTNPNFPDYQSYDPSQIRFVRQQPGTNGPPSTCAFDNDCQVVYAAAAATAVPNDGETGPPTKVRLLYAEALGVGNRCENNPDAYQLVYASATPNQMVHQSGCSSHVELLTPTLINAAPFAHDSSCDQLGYSFLEPGAAPPAHNYPCHPMQVAYDGNIAHVQTLPEGPENLSLVDRARELQHFLPRESLHAHSSFSYANRGISESYGTHMSASSSSTGSSSMGAESSHYSQDRFSRKPEPCYSQSHQPYASERQTDGLKTLAKAAAVRMEAMEVILRTFLFSCDT